MAAPKGQQFWKLRTKHGRDKIFKDPETLWQAACEYFEVTDKRRLVEVDYRGKDAVEVALPHMVPYTYEGLCLFLGVNTKYFEQFRRRTEDDGFSSVLSRIDDMIRQQKFEGATAGFFNPMLIARDLGLKDSKDVTGTITIEDLICGEGEDGE